MHKVSEAETNHAQKTRDETRHRILPASKTKIRKEQIYSCTRHVRGSKADHKASKLTHATSHRDLDLSELAAGKNGFGSSQFHHCSYSTVNLVSSQPSDRDMLKSSDCYNTVNLL
jgi:hypothetical protein